jgi:aerobic carbon-monoxide dehydrogenase small subunit
MSTIDTRSPVSQLSLRLNGKNVSLDARAGSRLLDVLREEAFLTGVKEGCGEGECGACTVLMNGKAVCACLTLAQTAEDTEIVTVEGLAGRVDQEMHPVQRHFIKTMGTQCGFCTPGMVLAAAQLLEDDPKASRDTILDGVSSVLCRCTGYTRIVQAVEDARDEMNAASKK